ncbi:hypothetical protein GIB67_019578 [Kingdonia uniflora]|uniref:Bromodomain associated domain-containing protein n=1 Tax=Kingdonia uniflora TaxID=39325 RepID=A0A7J7N126_9MAGN|nr:hypothetical protein GIB67_019578 [Kingdonia uniflora]
MDLLGEDGLGYDLARKLETYGVWRSWLGESNYTNFRHFLSSPSTWETFMNCDSSSSKTRAQIHLQLRVRALLFDKASVSLFLQSSPGSVSVSKLNPSYLQLRGDDVFFSLEDLNSVPLKAQTRPSSSKYAEPQVENVCERLGSDAFPETWYKQFIEKYKASKALPFGEREPQNRTSEGMSTYIKLMERHKRKRQPFTEDQYIGFGNSKWENGSKLHQTSISYGSNSVDDETFFLPEVMFRSNCVPDSALIPTNRLEDDKKMEFYGILDRLPHAMSRSPAMLDRYGIRPEYLKIGAEINKYKGGNGLEANVKTLGQEQASAMSKKVIARMLSDTGFESATEVPMEVLSQFLSSHISKLGGILKVLTDNYRKQFSAIEILKMFLQTVGYSNLGTLVAQVKDGTRKFSHPTQQQHLRGLETGFQTQHPNPSLQAQQVENTSELSIDSNTLAPISNRQSQMQFRQQQVAATMASVHPQSSHQFRQLSPLQTQNSGSVRAPPVKVEGFQELMGGDTTTKHDSEENKLTSPSK